MAENTILIDIKVTGQRIEEIKRQIDSLKESYKQLIKEEQREAAEIKKAEIQNLNASLREQNKLLQAQQTLIDQNTGYYKKLSAQLYILKDQYKNMSKAELDSSNGKALIKKIQDTDRELKKLDAQVGVHTRNVGNYASAWKGLGNVFSSLGIGIGIGTLTAALGDAVNTMKDFEKQVSRLKAVTGLSGQPLKDLSQAAIDLSINTGIAAKDIIENYTLIGSKMPDLLTNVEGMKEMGNAAILLAKAAGMPLPGATMNLVDIMNQFGAKSNEASKYVNILSDAALKGAAEIPQLADAMVRFGGIAKVSNVTVKESAAMIETLAATMKTADPEKMGTGIRNLLATLTAPSSLSKPAIEMLRQAGVNLARMSDTTLPLTERLKELAKIQGDVNKLEAVFGKENLEVGIKILGNVENIKKLSTGYQDNNIAAKQASDNTTNLSHALEKLKTAWDGTILTLNSDNGVTNSLTKYVDAVSYSILKVGELAKVQNQLTEFFSFLPSQITDTISSLSNPISGLINSFKLLFDGIKFGYESTKSILISLGIIKEEQVKLSEKHAQSAIDLANKYDSANGLMTNSKGSFLAGVLDSNIKEVESEKKKNAEILADTFRTLNEEKNAKTQAQKEETKRQREAQKEAQKEAEKIQKEVDKAEKLRRKEVLKLLETDQANNMANEIAMQTKILDQRAKIAQNTIAIDEGVYDAKKEFLYQSMDLATSLFEQNTIAYKALSIAQASMATYEGVAKASARAELFPFNFVLAGTILASGLANVAKIAGVEFANGGIINSGIPITPTAKGDNVMIKAKKGEVVLNEAQQNRIGFGTLAGAGVPGFATGGVVGSNLQKFKSRPTLNQNPRIIPVLVKRDLDKISRQQINELKIATN